MNHIVLYRKYRPSTFKEIIDQDDIAKTLQNQVIDDKVSHAYLFIGPRGTGKTSIARVISKAVNCLEPVNGEPCNKCISCKSINDGTTLDYIELDAATNNGVDDMRNLTETTHYTSSLLKRKVYVIDECHMLSKGAFNALLKTLEEPQGPSIFILATTEMEKIPKTIISRCTKMFFKRISFDALVKNLQYVCEKENRDAEINALKLIASNSDGAMRDALSLLDQAFAMCEGVISERIVAAMLGYSNNDTILGLIDVLLQRNFNSIITLLHEQLSRGKDIQSILSELTLRLRDCMMLKATNGQVILECTEDYKKRIEEIIKPITLADILSVISEVNKLSAATKFAPNALTIVETGITLMCLPQLDNDANLSGVISRINAMENKLNNIVSQGKVITKEIVIERIVSPNTINDEQLFTTSSKEESESQGSREESNKGNRDNNSDVKKEKTNVKVPSVPKSILSQIKPFDCNEDSCCSDRVKESPEQVPLSLFEKCVVSLRNEDVIFDTILMSSNYSLDIPNRIINITAIPPLAFVLNTVFKNLDGITLVVTEK